MPCILKLSVTNDATAWHLIELDFIPTADRDREDIDVIGMVAAQAALNIRLVESHNEV
jgi:hypothetical protein